ncbi:MAG: hypothetical protein P8J59_10190 [Phycisphaerales bacterium]|jgi:hypothetical protein|nr:hypothetical protein [Phycisphaerales bacterium]
MILRRTVLWSLICGISAVPSFLWGMEDFSVSAMLLGVAIFAAALSFISTLRLFRDFLERPFMRRTFRAGFAMRLLASAIVPLGVMVDLWPGLLATNIVQAAYGSLGYRLEESDFLATLLVTLLQGVNLNVLVVLVIFLLWLPQRLFLTYRPLSKSRCQDCGYELRTEHLPAGNRCPECGSDSGPGGAGSSYIERISTGRFAFLMTAMVIGVAVLQLTSSVFARYI